MAESRLNFRVGLCILFLQAQICPGRSAAPISRVSGADRAAVGIREIKAFVKGGKTVDFYAAYSPYAMLLILSTLACVTIGAFLFAYGLVKAEKGFLFWSLVAALVGLLFLPAAGLLALVSPSVELRDVYLGLRRSVAAFDVFPLLCVFFCAYRRGCGIRSCGATGLVFLIHIACVFSLLEGKAGVLADYLPVLDFCAFSVFLLFFGRGMFAELSPVSTDNFMQELDDMVLIFDKSGRLADANGQAKRLWPFLREGLTLDEFFENLKRTGAFRKLDEENGAARHEEVAFPVSGAIRHYQYGETCVSDKKGRVRATVLNFHDVTEKSLLEKELEEKNGELEKLNIRLKAFLDTAEMLVEEEQKARAAKDLKETAGSRIESLVSELEALSRGDARERLPELIESCREAMCDVRSAMQKLAQDGGRDGKDD